MESAARTVFLDRVVLIDRACPSLTRRQDMGKRRTESIVEDKKVLAFTTHQLVPERRVVDSCQVGHSGAECVNDFETPRARIYCRTPDVRAGRLAAVASFSGVSR